MTRRERLERKLEKRLEWAEGRIQKADAIDRQTPDSMRHDWAFNTQPGHIPERARMNRRDKRARENREMAQHHTQKAGGLEIQLRRSVFSDDEDAIEALEAKIAKLEKRQARMKLVNRFVRKNDKAGLMAALGCSEAVADAHFAPSDWTKKGGYPSYVLTNSNANIRRLKKRIGDIKRRHSETADARKAGGVVIYRTKPDHPPVCCSVVFAEKPERAILNDLKSAGFHWSGGRWNGYADRLPESVTALAAHDA